MTFLSNVWNLEPPLLAVSLLGNDKLKSQAGKAADKKFSEGMEKVNFTLLRWSGWRGSYILFGITAQEDFVH